MKLSPGVTSPGREPLVGWLYNGDFLHTGLAVAVAKLLERGDIGRTGR